jgi:membrane-associated phospholipid phosphatase
MKLPFNLILWFAGLLGTAAAVVASFFWLDRPVALFAHHYFRTPHHDVVEGVSYFPNPLVVLAAVLSIILGLRIILGRPFSWNQANTFVCSLSVLFTEATKSVLKFIFGRTWPETWTHNNPSFIRDGVFGFHFMHGGTAYQSFPSGHMAAICTVISVLWIRYPQFRLFYLVVGLLTGAGLVAANYHFVSDVVTGAFVGISIGWMATVIWDSCAARGIVPSINVMERHKITHG